jgi:hypothetical protein
MGLALIPVVPPDKKLTAFVELEAAIRACGDCACRAGQLFFTLRGALNGSAGLIRSLGLWSAIESC